MASSPWSVSHQVLQKWDYYPVLHWTHYSVNQPEVSWGAGSNRLQKYFLSKQAGSTNSPPTSRHLQAAKAGIWNSWFTHWTKAVFIITSKLQYILCSTALNGDFTSHHRWIYKWRKTGRPIKTRREKVSSADQNCSQKSEIIHKLFWENMFPNSPARQLGKRLKVEVGEISVVTDLVLPLSQISQSGDKPPEEELEGGSLLVPFSCNKYSPLSTLMFRGHRVFTIPTLPSFLMTVAIAGSLCWPPRHSFLTSYSCCFWSGNSPRFCSNQHASLGVCCGEENGTEGPACARQVAWWLAARTLILCLSKLPR